MEQFSVRTLLKSTGGGNMKDADVDDPLNVYGGPEYLSLGGFPLPSGLHLDILMTPAAALKLMNVKQQR